nr:hypothetical protein [Tanacetum cinerariifolium]
MDNQDITMEEYIRLENERARKHRQKFNWKTATYGKVKYFEDVSYFKDFVAEFPATIFNDALTSEQVDLNFEISFDESDEEDYTFTDWRHIWLRYEDPQYTNVIVMDYESRLSGIFTRQVNRFTDIKLGLDVVGLHTSEEMATKGFGAYWAGSLREIATKADLRDYWTVISSIGDFLTGVPFYTAIRNPLRKLCHHLIAFNISKRGQEPKKGFMMSGGHFIGRLAEHFRLLTKERLTGLTVVIPDLTRIDRDELAAAAGVLEVVEGAHAEEEGDQAVLVPVQAHHPPPPTDSRTMPQMMVSLEEEVHGLRESLGEQREVLDVMS